MSTTTCFLQRKIDHQRFGCQSQKTEKLTLATSLTPNATRPTVFWTREYFWAWIIEAERLHKTTYVDFRFRPYFCRNRPSNFTIFFVRFAVNRRRTKWPVQKSLEEIKWWIFLSEEAYPWYNKYLPVFILRPPEAFWHPFEIGCAVTKNHFRVGRKGHKTLW
jgi:hypothetical protein